MNLRLEEHPWNSPDRDDAPAEPAPQVVKRAAAGDLRALATLYEAHAPPAFRMALRITGSMQDAQDVVQDLFLGLPEALSSYRGDSSFVTWFSSCAARLALRQLRDRRRRQEVALKPDWSLGIEDPDRIDQLELEEALHRLPDALRAVVVLRDIEGFKHHEVARMLGISHVSSRMRLSRARQLLRDWLGRR